MSTAPSEDRLSKVVIGATVALVLLALACMSVFGSTIGFGETQPLEPLIWVLPTAQAFIVLAALAVAFLCLGRYLALGAVWAYWIGASFLASAILSIFYVLSWPGLLDERGVIAQSPNTSAWFFFLTFSVFSPILLAINSAAATRLKLPANVYVFYFLVVTVSALIGVLSVLFESALPALVDGLIFTPLTFAWTGVLVLVFALGAVLAFHLHKKNRDVLLEYMTLFFTLTAFALLYAILGGKRFDFWWYVSRFIYVLAFLVPLFGLLQEGYALFSRERERVEERERLLKAVENSAVESRRRAAQLEVSNKELQSFAYTLAHDLRAPLRHIDGFSKILLRDYPDKPLDEQGNEYLRLLRANSQRMGQLIDDLLNLSRVARAEIHRQTVDLSEIAHSILADLRQQEPGRQAEMVITPGMMVNADPSLIRLTLQHLFGNAWKFTSTRPVARIEFGVMQQEGKSVYFVRDNGVGFDMAYADKLFQPFGRLHKREEFSGTGIGLALVSRIVRRHGGQVWGEGAVDQGATFYFTLG